MGGDGHSSVLIAMGMHARVTVIGEGDGEGDNSTAVLAKGG